MAHFYWGVRGLWFIWLKDLKATGRLRHFMIKVFCAILKPAPFFVNKSNIFWQLKSISSSRPLDHLSIQTEQYLHPPVVFGASPRSGSHSQHSKVSLPGRLPEVDEPTSHHQIRNRLPGEKLQNIKYKICYSETAWNAFATRKKKYFMPKVCKKRASKPAWH